MELINFKNGTITIENIVYSGSFGEGLVFGLILTHAKYYPENISRLKYIVESCRDHIIKEKSYPKLLFRVSGSGLLPNPDISSFKQVYNSLFPEANYNLKDILLWIFPHGSIIIAEFIVNDYLKYHKRKLLTEEEISRITRISHTFGGSTKKLKFLIEKSNKGIICPFSWIFSGLYCKDKHISFLLSSIKKGDICIENSYGKEIEFFHDGSEENLEKIKEIESLVKWIELGLENMLKFSSSL